MSPPNRKEGQPVKHRMWIAGALLALLWATPAKADTPVIVRTTGGLSALQTFCSLPTTCTVVGSVDGTLGQVFLVTTPLDPATFIGLLSNPLTGLTGFVDAEVDQVLSLIGGLNVVPTPINQRRPSWKSRMRKTRSMCRARGLLRTSTPEWIPPTRY